MPLQLTHKEQHLFKNAGINVSMFGQELAVGDTVLVKSYGSAAVDSVATVLKINKKSVAIEVDATYIDWGNYHPKPSGHTGTWDYWPNKRYYENEKKRMLRSGSDMIKIPSELVDQIQQEKKDLFNKYPEILI